MPARPGLITAQQLADKLNLSVETIWRYTRTKRIPYLEVGARQYRYDAEQVLNAIGNPVERAAEEGRAYSADSPFTYEDYLRLPEESGVRHEVLDGLLVKDPSPGIRHQRVSARLQGVLRDYFRSVDPDGEVLDAPLDVVLSDRTVVQPDLLFIPGSQKAVLQQTYVFVAPHLVVEILSSTTARRDRLQKMEIYRRARVVHYWIVDPEICLIEPYVLRGDSYTRVPVDCDTVFTHPDFPDLRISTADIFPA